MRAFVHEYARNMSGWSPSRPNRTRAVNLMMRRVGTNMMSYSLARMIGSLTRSVTVSTHLLVSVRVSADGFGSCATGGVYEAEKSFTIMRKILKSFESYLSESFSSLSSSLRILLNWISFAFTAAAARISDARTWRC